MKAWICRDRDSRKINLFLDRPEKHWKKIKGYTNAPVLDEKQMENAYPFWSSWNREVGAERKITICEAATADCDKSLRPEIRKIQDLDPHWEDEEPIEIEVNINVIDTNDERK